MSSRYLLAEPNYLLHYGVKGMRWRVRKDQSAINQKTNSIKNRRTHKSGKLVRGTSELWEIGKMVVESILGGDEGAF